MAFEFTKANIKKSQAYIKKYPKGRSQSAVKAILDLAQRQNGGWISNDCIEYVANFLEMPFVRVMEIATFYNMFNLKPVGKYHIKICGTTPCWLRGAEDIKNTCQDHLGINMDEITDDHVFSLAEVECLGACVNAPLIQINDDYYEDLHPEAVREILSNLADGKPVKVGSCIGRQGSKAKDDVK